MITWLMPEASLQGDASITCDVAVIGGGIVGLATAHAVMEAHPELEVVVIEKEERVATHQTGRNSGVVHSGIYYRPGSLKAKLCREGAVALKVFCLQNGVTYDECGKVIVAADNRELPRLHTLLERGHENGVPGLELLSAAELREIEPNVQGVAAIWSPETAIVDFSEVAEKLAAVLRERGARILLGAKVTGVARHGELVNLACGSSSVTASKVVNCAGLYSDALARLAGATPPVRIVPFRGEYYLFKPEALGFVKALVYPVPDPDLPFLGVHFTRTVHGELEAGPNAVLAFAREGYSWSRLSLRELGWTLRFGGFWRLARRYWRVGAYEVYRSLFKGAFVRSLKRLAPAVSADELVPGHRGVRAQAVSEDGQLVDDFVMVGDGQMLHVLNAPSPAATASLAIGRRIVQGLSFKA